MSLSQYQPLPFRLWISDNRLVFKIKDGYKLELQMPETMKLFSSTKKVIDEINDGEKVRLEVSLEVVEVVSGHCVLADNQYPQRSELLYTFTPNKCYAYLLNIEPSNPVFLKTYNTDFGEIIMTFTDKNRMPLEIEDKGNVTFLINICDDIL